jgi:DNA-binding transcriptional LysR family regulator
VAVKLGIVSRVLIAGPDYLSARAIPNTSSDLAGHDIIAFESIDATNEWRRSTNDKPVRVEPRLIVNSADAAIAAAEAGIGIGIGIARALSYQVMASVQAGQLVTVLQQFAPPPSRVSAIYPMGRIASANLSAFIKAARSHFRTNPIAPAGDWQVPQLA